MQTLLSRRASALHLSSPTRSPTHPFRPLQTCLPLLGSYHGPTYFDHFRTYITPPPRLFARLEHHSRTLLTRKEIRGDEKSIKQHLSSVDAEDAKDSRRVDKEAKGQPDPEVATTKESTPHTQPRKTKKECPPGFHYVKPSYRHSSYRKAKSVSNHKSSTEVGSHAARSLVPKSNMKAGKRKDPDDRELEFCLTGSAIVYEKDDLGNGKWSGR